MKKFTILFPIKRLKDHKLLITLKYSKETTCIAGFSYVLADDAKFAYAMINIAF